MVRIRLIPKADAQPARRVTHPGVRKQRRTEFDAYAQVLLEHPGAAVLYGDIDEPPQRFIQSLHSACRRAGVTAVIRKVRGQNDVRAWLVLPADSAAVAD